MEAGFCGLTSNLKMRSVHFHANIAKNVFEKIATNHDLHKRQRLTGGLGQEQTGAGLEQATNPPLKANRSNTL
jgi:hypothetical protein